VWGQDDGRYFLQEFRPNGRLCDGQWGSGSFHCWDEPALKALLAECGPNELRERAAAAGIDMSRAVSGGAGYGVYSRFLPSLAACAEAVNDALTANQWYSAEDEALKNDPAFQRELRERERHERAAYRAQQRAALAQAEAVNHGLFKGCATMLGPLPEKTQKAILAYLNAPSAERWDDIANAIIDGVHTLWAAWCEVDPEAPRSRPLDGPWPQIPEPETLRRAIRTSVEQRARHLNEDKEDGPRPRPIISPDPTP